MSITKNESRLIDERRKQRHSEQTGYDYSKQVQAEIQALVEMHIEFQEQLRNPKLIPSAGLNNGVRIKQEDIDAYSEAHPQNAASARDRRRIVDLLSAGNSTMDEIEQQQQSQQEIKDSKVELNPHKRFPPIAEVYSHLVTDAVWCYVQPDNIVENQHRVLDADEQIIIIDDFVGSDGKMAYCKSVRNPSYKTFYVLKEHLYPKEGLPEPTPFDIEKRESIPSGGEIPDWTTLKDDQPVEYSQKAEIHICVSLDRFSLTTADRPAALEEAFYKGMQKILEFKNKENSIEYITERFVQNSYWDKPAQAFELFLDPRIASRVRGIVKVPVRNIIPLDDKEPEFQFHEDYKLSDFKDNIEKVYEKLESIGEDIDNFDGKVVQFDSKQESEKFEQIIDNIESLVKKNEDFVYKETSFFSSDSIYDQEGDITIYWDENLKPVMVKHKPNSGKKFWFKEGFGEFAQSPSMTSRRTQFLLMHMEDVVKDIDFPWKDFLTGWIAYDDVKIIPKEEAIEVPVIEEKEGPKRKTREQLLKENNFYENPERKIKIQEEREKQSDDVAPEVLSSKKKITWESEIKKGSEDIYDHFINKINIQKMALDAASCLLKDVPATNIRQMYSDFELLRKEYNRTKKEFKEEGLGALAFFIPDDNPTDDISSAFFKNLKYQMEGILSSLISSTVGNILGGFFNSCAKDNLEDVAEPQPSVAKNLLQNLQDMMQDLFDEGEIDAAIFSNLMDDLANLLTLKELCDLFRGIPSDTTMNILRELLKTSYCELGLKTDEEIINFFLSVSEYSDLKICDEIGQELDKIPEDILCPPSSQLRDSLLGEKGLTEDEIAEQLERERARARKLADQIINDLLSKGGMTPNLFCSVDENGNSIPGSTSFMDEQFEFTFESTLSSLFRGTYDSFSEEGSVYVQNLFSEYEVERDKHIDIFGNIHPAPGNPAHNADIYVGTRKVSETKRRPVPHLVDFYQRPSMDNSSPNSFEIKVPFIKQSENYSGLDILGGLSSSDLFNRDSSIKYTSLSYCDFLRKKKAAELSITPVANDEPEFEYNTDVIVPDDKCKDNALAPQVQVLENTDFVNPENPVELVMEITGGELTEEEAKQCLNTRKLGSSMEIEGIEYFGEREMTEEVHSFVRSNLNVNQMERLSDISIFNAILNNSFEQPQIVENNIPETGLPFRAVANVGANSVSDMSSQVSEVLPFLYEEVRNNILNTLTLDIVVNSPYLKSSVHDGFSRYVLEYINLGPTPTPECDPHLLKISQLIEEMKKSAQAEMCLDATMNDSSKPSPVERMMMKACIKATIRFYIIETLSMGILTSARFYDRSNKISDLKAAYIVDRMLEMMQRYNPAGRNSDNSRRGCDTQKSELFSQGLPLYSFDFIKQVEEAYGEENNSRNNLLKKIVKEEYEIVASGFYEALMIDPESDNKFDKDTLFELAPQVRISDISFDIEDKDLDGIKKDELAESLFRSISGGELTNKESGMVNKISNIRFHLTPTQGAVRDRTPFIKLEIGGKLLFCMVSRGSNDVIEFMEKHYTLFTFGTGTSVTNFSKFVIPLFEFDSGEEIRIIKSALLEYCFPIGEYTTVISTHEVETVHNIPTIPLAFGQTRDNLYSLFYAIKPESNDWAKQHKAMEAMGGPGVFTKVFDFNNGVLDTPCTEFSFNLGMGGLCWGNSFDGLGSSFATALRLARDAALIQFKEFVERNDPAVKLASRLSFLSKLACLNIPTSAIAAGLNSTYPMIFPPTFTAAAYHALGLGIFASSANLSSDSEEGRKARDEVRNAGLKLPPYCGVPIEDPEQVQIVQMPVLRDPRTSPTSVMTAEEISQLEQRSAELRTRLSEVDAGYTRSLSAKRTIEDDINSYNSYGRRQFHNRLAPEELLDEPKFEWYIIEDDLRSFTVERREIETELTEITIKLNRVQR